MKIGETVFEKFEVLSTIGFSAMSEVVKARHTLLDRAFVLKVLKSETFNERSLIRFQNEARILSKLNHPNIATVYDFGLSKDCVPYLAIEFIEGETLSDFLDEFGPLSPADAIPLILQLCDALAHAHGVGIIHRDIKPSNIMIQKIDGNTRAVLLDFGVAKLVTDDDDQRLTKAGDLVGTPAYMSPEQCEGKQIDETADQYSLGCVIFAMLTGRPPFMGESALQTMLMHQNEEPPKLSANCSRTVTPELDHIVATLLAKKGEDRFETITALADALSPPISLEQAQSEDTENLSSDLEPHSKPVLRKNLRQGIMLTGASLSFLTLLSFLVIRLSDPFTTETEKPTITKTPSADLSFGPATKTLIADKIKRGDLRFRLVDMGATDDDMLAFTRYTYAQSVDLDKSSVTDQGLASLKDSKVLKLSLTNCDQVKSVHNVAKLTYLQDLDLGYTNINDSDLDELARLRMLSHLDLTGCDITENGLAKLIPSTSLTRVTLTNDGRFSNKINVFMQKMPQCSFPPYSEKTALELAEMQSKSKDPYSKYCDLYSVAKKANPLCSAVSVYLCTRAAFLFQQGRRAEARKLMKEELELSEQSGNLKNLAVSLHWEAEFKAEEGKTKEAVELVDRALQLSQDTMFKDDPQLPELIYALTKYPQSVGDIDRVVLYCQTGIDLLKRHTIKPREELLPLFYDKAGWMYYSHSNQDKVMLQKALPYFQKNVALFNSRKQTNTTFYGKTLIEVGHCLPDDKARIATYKQGLALLDHLGLPEEDNLKEHYCDACFNLAQIYDRESKPALAVDSLRRALDVVKGMKHFDKYRDTIYRNALAAYRLSPVGR